MTDDEREMSTPPTPPPAKKGKSKLLLIALVLLILGGGAGGGAWWWMAKSQAASGHDAKAGEHAEPATESGVLALEQFTVNLADPETSRFLRATVHLVLSDGAAVKEIEEDKVQLVRLRSSVLELLTTQTSSRITTAEGKTELKHAIAAKTSEILKPIKVIDVLFSDFVVQF
jgi:flagellar protein FliL